jgi:hypothetical protein
MAQTTSHPTRYQTTLAQLGLFLVGENALEIDIVDEGSFLAVTWSTPAHDRVQRCFREGDLAHVRQLTDQGRTGSVGRAALLGALGTEIDRARLNVGHIIEESDGFLVTGSLRGMYTAVRFSYPQLRGSARPSPAQPMQAAPSALTSSAAIPPDPDASALRYAKGDTEVIPREALGHLTR